MKIPMALRVDVVLAVVRGRAHSISFSDSLYRVELERVHLKRWFRRRERRQKKAGQR